MTPSEQTWPVHGTITGPIVMIGFGSIGCGTLPLIERHFHFDKSRFVVIDPDDTDRALLDERGVKFLHLAITRFEPKTIVCLGDNFHDPGGPERLDAESRGLISLVQRKRRFVWIEGNHDAASAAVLGGEWDLAFESLARV